MIRDVIIVNDFALVNGGAAKVAIEEALGLAEQGYQVTFFAAVGPVDARLATAGLPVICLEQKEILHESSTTAAWQGIRNQVALRRFRQLFTERRFDPRRTIVHFHGWVKALSPYIFTIPTEFQLKSVVTLHDFFIACPNGGLIDYPRAAVCPLRPLSFACLSSDCDSRSYAHKLWRFGRTWAQNNLVDISRYAFPFICVSQFLERKLERYLPPDVPRLTVDNAVEVVRNEPCRPEESRQFLYVGRLSAEKGALLFARAAAAAGVDATFVGVGEEEAAIRAAHPAARLTGWLAPAEVKREMRKSRALVFPSLWYEAQGLVAYEALAEGLPVICSDVCAATEIVRQGENGYLFASGSLPALRDALKEMAGSANGRELGRRAYDSFWMEDRSLSRHLANLLQVYEQRLCEESLPPQMSRSQSAGASS